MSAETLYERYRDGMEQAGVEVARAWHELSWNEQEGWRLVLQLLWDGRLG